MANFSIQFDHKQKVIILLSDFNLKDFELLKRFIGKNWKEWKILAK